MTPGFDAACVPSEAPRVRAECSPTHQKSRSRSNCKCAGPCFYCGGDLAERRHEHDHAPVPWRHGGRLTVPACRQCHNLKDRVPIAEWPEGLMESACATATVEAGLSLFAAMVAQAAAGQDWFVIDGATVLEIVARAEHWALRILLMRAYAYALDGRGYLTWDDAMAAGEVD